MGVGAHRRSVNFDRRSPADPTGPSEKSDPRDTPAVTQADSYLALTGPVDVHRLAGYAAHPGAVSREVDHGGYLALSPSHRDRAHRLRRRRIVTAGVGRRAGGVTPVSRRAARREGGRLPWRLHRLL